MDNSKSVADRIRPILQAMERSIDSARRSRVKDPVHPPAAQPAVGLRPPSPQTSNLPVPPKDASPITDGGQRLKARPKRLGSPFISPFDPPTYRSQAS